MRQIVESNNWQVAIGICAAVLSTVIGPLAWSVVDLDRATAIEAARLWLLHGIAMAGSVTLATAQRHRAMLWTQDSDFDGSPGVKYYAKR